MAKYVLAKPVYFKGTRFRIGQIVDDSVVRPERAEALIRMKVITKILEESEEQQESSEKTVSSNGSKEEN